MTAIFSHTPSRVRRKRWCGAVAGVAALSIVMAGSCISASAATSTPYVKHDVKAPAEALTAAGSTFDAPFFTKAFYDFYKATTTGVSVAYAAIGSGGGQKQFEAETVDFGASDVPMTKTALAKAKGGTVLQVPVCLGGEAISYNVPGLKSGLKLSPTVLVDIFLGTIKTWNNAAIEKLNPKVKLPDEPITTVHRATGSGTTYIFTNYLSTVSPTWVKKVGKGKTVSWPNGIAGEGNEGVAGLISETPYSIGYVELDYAIVNHFTYAAIGNKTGTYVLPSKATVATDAAEKPTITSTNFAIVNQKGKGSYPISGYSWALLYEHQKTKTVGTAVVDLLDWLTHAPGQTVAGSLDYVPLPGNIQALARTTLLKAVGPTGATLLQK